MGGGEISTELQIVPSHDLGHVVAVSVCGIGVIGSLWPDTFRILPKASRIHIGARADINGGELAAGAVVIEIALRVAGGKLPVARQT